MFGTTSDGAMRWFDNPRLSVGGEDGPAVRMGLSRTTQFSKSLIRFELDRVAAFLGRTPTRAGAIIVEIKLLYINKLKINSYCSCARGSCF